MRPALKEGMKTIITTLVFGYALLIAVLTCLPTPSSQVIAKGPNDSLTTSFIFRSNLTTIHNKLDKKKIRFV